MCFRSIRMSILACRVNLDVINRSFSYQSPKLRCRIVRSRDRRRWLPRVVRLSRGERDRSTQTEEATRSLVACRKRRGDIEASRSNGRDVTRSPIYERAFVGETETKYVHVSPNTVSTHAEILVWTKSNIDCYPIGARNTSPAMKRSMRNNF